jgi:hypothetical protein
MNLLNKDVLELILSYFIGPLMKYDNVDDEKFKKRSYMNYCLSDNELANIKNMDVVSVNRLARCSKLLHDIANKCNIWNQIDNFMEIWTTMMSKSNYYDRLMPYSKYTCHQNNKIKNGNVPGMRSFYQTIVKSPELLMTKITNSTMVRNMFIAASINILIDSSRLRIENFIDMSSTDDCLLVEFNKLVTNFNTNFGLNHETEKQIRTSLKVLKNKLTIHDFLSESTVGGSTYTLHSIYYTIGKLNISLCMNFFQGQVSAVTYTLSVCKLDHEKKYTTIFNFQYCEDIIQTYGIPDSNEFGIDKILGLFDLQASSIEYKLNLYTSIIIILFQIGYKKHPDFTLISNPINFPDDTQRVKSLDNGQYYLKKNYFKLLLSLNFDKADRIFINYIEMDRGDGKYKPTLYNLAGALLTTKFSISYMRGLRELYYRDLIDQYQKAITEDISRTNINCLFTDTRDIACCSKENESIIRCNSGDLYNLFFDDEIDEKQDKVYKFGDDKYNNYERFSYLYSHLNSKAKMMIYEKETIIDNEELLKYLQEYNNDRINRYLFIKSL